MKAWEAFKAHCEGKQVQFKRKDCNEWINSISNESWMKSDDDKYDFRLKPEPLKVEGIVEWDELHGNMTPVHITSDNGNWLGVFKGKKTKITVEEIVE